MRVREATTDDLAGLEDLANELSDLQAPWRVFEPREGFLRGILEAWRAAVADRDGAAILFVAEDDDGLVGAAFAEVARGSELSDIAAVELSGVIVTADARGKGVGKALVRAAAGFARDRGVGWLTLKTFAGNQEALAFWERNGFSQRVVQLVASSEDIL